MSLHTGTYPADWPAIAKAVKDAAGWRCVRCDHPHDPASGHTLTVHHLDLDKGNGRWWNTIALCQRCHLRIQGKVDLGRPWVMAAHSAWFEPYVAGWYAWRYLGEDLSRDEVEARLPELLALEPAFVLGGTP
jgi:5-methylcytosine-specific restriction endonuclease McrA